MEGLMLEKAIEYSQRGWKVVPLHMVHSAAKHPQIKELQKRCFADARQIQEWWEAWPDISWDCDGKCVGLFCCGH